MLSRGWRARCLNNADQGHTSVFLFILTVRVRRFFTFVFYFSCKLLISNGQPLRPGGFLLRLNLPQPFGLRSDMPSFADAQSGMARPMPQCPPRPSEPHRHFHISDFMRALRTLRVLICGIGGRDGSPSRPSYCGGFGLSAVLAQAGETRPTRPLGSHKM